MSEHTCGYYRPSKSKRAIRRAMRVLGSREFVERRMKPCGKPATFVSDPDPMDANPRTLYLCTPHAMHNARRGFPSKRIKVQP